MFGMVAMLLACDKYMDVHQEFVQSGEIIYAPKLDSVAVYAGKERLKLGLYYFNGHHLQTTVIKWNNNQDSMMIQLKDHNLQSGLDSLEVFIPNLEQNAYSFTLYNIDVHGSRSLSTPAFGSVYGVDFQSGLANRRIRNLHNFGEDGFLIEWLGAEETMVGMEIRLVDDVTQQEMIFRRPVESLSEMRVKPRQGQFYMRSLFLPETTAVDTFYTTWSDVIQLQ